MRKIFQVLALALAAGAAAAAQGCGSGWEEEVGTEGSQLLSDPTTQRVLGFESLPDWTILQGPGTLALSSTHTQGASSLQVTGPGYTIVQSALLPTLGSVGNTLSVDYQVPSTLAWGSLSLILNSPTLGLYSDYIGQVNVGGIAGGSFQTATFTLPANVVTLLASSYSDLSIRLNWNVPSVSGGFLLDNVRFPNASVGDAGAGDATTGDSGKTDGAADAGLDAAQDAAADAGSGDGSISPRTVFGKPNFKQITVNDVVPYRAFQPQGVVVDRSATPNRVYVFDSGNQRILGFKSLGTCSTSGATCTRDGECPSGQTCNVIYPTRSADVVIGQPDGGATTCNGDDTSSQPPTASTLCTEPYPRSVSLLESGDPQSMAVDSAGNLYITDKWNHRILKYNSPMTTDAVADMVWGQNDMVSRQCNQGAGPPSTGGQPSQTSLCLSDELTGTISGDELGTGVDVQADGQIWVADQANHRVLRFPANSKVANMVLGQATYTSGTPDPTECNASGTTNSGSHLCMPKAVRYNATTKQLYVLDWKSGTSKFRVLIYSIPTGKTDFQPGQPATSWVVGDPWYNCQALNDCPGDPDAGAGYSLADTSFQWNRPLGIELPTNLAANSFWLSDEKNGRAVGYALQGSAWSAVTVLGQPNATSNGGFSSCPTSTTNNNWCNFTAPGGSMGFDGDGNIYVADENQPRVMRFPTKGLAVLDGGTQQPPWAANALLFPNIQGDSTDNNLVDQYGAFSLNKVKLASYPSGSPQLLLFDQFRFLFWNSYSSKGSGSAADGVLYQSSFNSNAGVQPINGLDTDSKGHVFVGINGRIDIYQGPLATGMGNIASFDVNSVPLRIGGGTLAPTSIGIMGLAYDETNDALFVADTTNFRIIRIATPMQSTRQINLVLGQRSATLVGANRSYDDASKNICENVQPDGFGNISQIKLDKNGNLYVVDAIHEGWACSNNRVVEYDAATILPGTTDFISCDATSTSCTTAKRPTRYFVAGNPNSGTYPGNPPIGQRKGSDGNLNFGNGDLAPNVPIGVAFDSSNRMIMVLDAYENTPFHRVFYYATPLPNCSSSNPGCYVPFTSIFPVQAGQPTDVSFDSSNNMALMDQTWARVTYYAGTDYAAWVATQPTH
jgi:sugar lactone lactonase YvrE